MLSYIILKGDFGVDNKEKSCLEFVFLDSEEEVPYHRECVLSLDGEKIKK